MKKYLKNVKPSILNLSILIPTLPARKNLLERLLAQIEAQRIFAQGKTFEVLTDDRTDVSIGEKRNSLLSKSTGDYVCFIDDDDRIADTYLFHVMWGIYSLPDCCSLIGVITTDGKNSKIFKHSIDYKKYEEVDNVYYRFPNHLNVIKSSIAKQFKFPEKNHGEDYDWAVKVKKSGLLQREYKIAHPIYYYDYISKKNA